MFWFTFSNCCLDDASQIFYLTHVWRLCRPIQKLDSMVVHLGLISSGSVTGKIVLFKDWMLSTSAVERAQVVGSMWCCKLWQYLGEFIVPSQTVTCPTFPALIDPQTILLPPPCFTVTTVQAGTYSSSLLLGLDIARSWTHLTIESLPSVLVSTDGILHHTYVWLFFVSPL